MRSNTQKASDQYRFSVTGVISYTATFTLEAVLLRLYAVLAPLLFLISQKHNQYDCDKLDYHIVKVALCHRLHCTILTMLGDLLSDN